MTLLRHRMIEDLQLRGMSERTHARYVRAVRQLADHSHKSPEQITEEALRDSFLSLTNIKRYSRRASPMARCGITGFSEQPLPRAWTPLTFVSAPREQTLPVGLSPEEVRTVLAPLRLFRSRACLTTISSCGLRLQAGTPLQVPESESARLLVHVRCGTGAKDRSGPLPPQTLALLRQSWSTPRHPLWLFPAPGRSGLGMATATAPMPSNSVQDAVRAALKARGLKKRASVHTRRPRSATPLLEAGVTRRRLQDS